VENKEKEKNDLFSEIGGREKANKPSLTRLDSLLNRVGARPFESLLSISQAPV